jgi:16S rRNA (guanine527-N7)-methyltransferase
MNAQCLNEGLQQMGLQSTSEQQSRLLEYVDLLERWNQTYNLTAIREPQRMVAYHLLDSLSIVDAIPQGARCLDIGTGAGLPGIPLAILRSDTDWVLLDSNGKKTRFVQQAIAALGLSHVKVVQTRVEDYHADSAFDVIVSRAFASLADFITGVSGLWQDDTRLLTMKTELSDEEAAAIDQSIYNLHVTQLKVPGVAEKRCLVNIERRKS